MTHTKTLLVVFCLWRVFASTNVIAFEKDFSATDLSQLSWSFQPLPSREELRSDREQSGSRQSEQPIDRYIRRALQVEGLNLSQRALPHRQIRRLSLMLTGLPPDPQLVQQFCENPTDEHYARLVQHYLDSPHFGERWARHWMDVVRYAETWGYEWNHLVREAWRYRDYLIRAFNQDVPYDQLVREHIAGDLLESPRVNMDLGINESLIGTAFYRFGETGHDDCVLYSDISLDVMDNQIDTLTKAFQALTVSCSRCHDHKMDDIPQRDYYSLLGVMTSSRQVIRTLDLPGRQDKLKRELRLVKRLIRRELGVIWSKEAADISSATLNDLTSEQRVEPSGSLEMNHPLFTWQEMSSVSEGAWEAKWTEARRAMTKEQQRREAFNIENYVSFGDFSKHGQSDPRWGFEGLSVEGGECFAAPGDFSVLPTGSNVITGILPAGFYSHVLSSKLNAVIRSPLLPEDKKYVSYKSMGLKQSVCRTVIANCTLPYFHTNRFDSSKLGWSTVDLGHIRKSPLVRFRSYLEWATALDDQGYPVLNMPQAEYQKLLDDPRSSFGVTQVFLHDVNQPPFESLQPQRLVFESLAVDQDSLAARYRQILTAAITRWSAENSEPNDVFWINAFVELNLLSREQDTTSRLGQLVKTYREIESQVQTPRRIVGFADHYEGVDVPLLIGGDVGDPQDIVHRGFLTAIASRFSQPPVQTGSGRLQMAELIAHPENPLTSRVFVNRIWHHLFGHGIVRSVDNFGNLGDDPTHPKLLDYLARQLIDSGWSMKFVIREIVLSDTFRQSSATQPHAKPKDPENMLLHRYPSRRMEAETIRDAILATSGRLELAMFGPSVDPYRPEDVDSRKLYAGPLDGAGRRSLYLKVTRMGPSKLLELFNFPDPSSTRGSRDRTNVPAQALGLMNHPFVHQQAQVSAQRLLQEANSNSDFSSRLTSLFHRMLSRPPTPVELGEYTQFFERLRAAHGVSTQEAIGSNAVWKEFIHSLYNLKEFTYVL